MIYWIGYILYIIGIRTYMLIIAIAAIFNQKAKLAHEGRKGLLNQIEKAIGSDTRRKVWYHCASLGEFEQVRPILEQLKIKMPDYAVVVTFFSPSGYVIRKNYSLADYVFYLPFDTRAHARRFIQLVAPSLVFFTKYDLWYHFLCEAQKKNAKIYLVSASFRPAQIYFKWYGTFFRTMLHFFDHIFSQFENSTLLLRQFGVTHSSTSGDTRYDRVTALASQSGALERIRLFKGGHPLLVLGSSYLFEEQMVAQLLVTASYRRLKVVVVPHEVTEQRLLEIEKTFITQKVQRYSCLKNEEAISLDVVVVDAMGLLGQIYQYADVSFVGGGFGNKGIHNILEPLAHGSPVIIGPHNHQKFPETQLAKSEGVCYTVATLTELESTLNNLLDQQNNLQLAKHNSRLFISSRTGATKLLLAHLGL